jgi:hypothetical protein
MYSVQDLTKQNVLESMRKLFQSPELALAVLGPPGSRPSPEVAGNNFGKIFLAMCATQVNVHPTEHSPLFFHLTSAANSVKLAAFLQLMLTLKVDPKCLSSLVSPQFYANPPEDGHSFSHMLTLLGLFMTPFGSCYPALFKVLDEKYYLINLYWGLPYSVLLEDFCERFRRLKNDSSVALSDAAALQNHLESIFYLLPSMSNVSLFLILRIVSRPSSVLVRLLGPDLQARARPLLVPRPPPLLVQVLLNGV